MAAARLSSATSRATSARRARKNRGISSWSASMRFRASASPGPPFAGGCLLTAATLLSSPLCASRLHPLHDYDAVARCRSLRALLRDGCGGCRLIVWVAVVLPEDRQGAVGAPRAAAFGRARSSAWIRSTRRAAARSGRRLEGRSPSMKTSRRRAMVSSTSKATPA